MSELEGGVDRRTGRVLGVRIDAIDWDAAIRRILTWATCRDSRYITICNSHVVVTAAQEDAYRRIIDGSDMATPDGAPVAWMLRRTVNPSQKRISGPDLMWALCEACSGRRVPVYFYGSTDETLQRLVECLRKAFPALAVGGAFSPPFRPLSEAEDQAAVEAINGSGAGVVFVGLGCPKQERWMHDHRGRVNAVMIGVGAAFDFHAGVVRRAPVWMQNMGLEWLHRLMSEPRRLWKRYLVTNTLFIIGAIKQLLARREGA